MDDQHKAFMQQAIALSKQGMDNDAGGPFGAIIVKDGQIVATGFNTTTSTNNPTAHAEINAIRAACAVLNAYDLSDCTLYASCEPCPMCLGAIYWAHIPTVYYAGTREDAAAIGFDDSHIYQELTKPMPDREATFTQLSQAEAKEVFEAWNKKPDKTPY